MANISIFLKMEGDKPINRIWDFLIVNSEYDYSLKDISKLANVSYSMVKLIFKNYFIPRKLVIERAVGQAKLFHLDFENSVVEKFRQYYWAVIENNTNFDKEKPIKCVVC